MTIALAALALAPPPDGISPILPIASGAPPILLGYLACYFASRRMLKARALEAGR